MAAQVVEEDAIFIALFLLVMGVHIASWERRKGAQLARLGEVGHPLRSLSSGLLWTPAGRQAGSLLTVDHHVVAQDTGCVEGSLPWALQPIPALQGCPHTPIYMEELSGVHPHREPMGEGRRKGSGHEGPLSLLWAVNVV